MITSVKGMRDLLPPETRVWNRLEETTRTVFSLYGYDEIRTPSLEPTELFVRSVGEASDIVHKEMYSFTDRGGREVSLRPENTAGVARAFIEHGMPQAGGVKKLYYVGPQYRYERPQKGRYREFRQIGAEVLGAADPATDAELLVMLFDLLGRARLHGALRLAQQRRKRGLPAGVRRGAPRVPPRARGEMGEDDRRRLRENPLRVLDTKDRSLAEVLAGAPRVLDHLDPASLAHHEELLALLDAERIPYRVEPRLVRGLDYYTRTVFEVTAQGLGAQDALLGGGRYDRLVSDLGGPKTPGIGFAIGEDRLVDVLPEAFRRAAIEGFAPVALVAIEPSDRAAALALAGELRRAGIAVDFDPAGKGPGAGLKAASKRGCRTAVLVGGRERESGIAIVKDLVERSQREVPLADLPRVLKGETP